MPNPNPPLRTPRLHLEAQTRHHAPAMMRALADPRMYAFIPSDPPDDEPALRERYARLETRRSPDGHEHWLNWVVLLNGEAIGRVEATVHANESRSDIAYLLHPDFWGHGYAVEAVTAMLEHLRDHLHVGTFSATVDTRNAASQRLLERLGFQRTRLIEHADEFKGSVSDEFEYRLG